MKDRTGLEDQVPLRVTVEFTDAVNRSLGVRWSPATEAGARKKFEYARIFLVELSDRPHRTYLDIVEHHPWTSVQLPPALAAGEYAIEIDAYGSASWGDGRLDAHGRSPSFTVGPVPTGEPAA
ncbi:hypothetical protein [Nocardia huaxiensis]|uniref:Fibronectin type-III domain-containing protein n=1 Tax=Nocardia huaxiensis TaxID=2755382 RepID=A0A7D6Z553_9NOCA|nr:hypothetical protein [Nocardia huaxiensis]QLY33166.1 hypothetical protein H0264_13855 [Nocardia huaxiensis]UFS93061.1 hypothetical protein LPY97_19505 [Nocardia huaxiensis]